MSVELKETVGLIIAGLSLLITVVMIICLWVMTKRNVELRKTIKSSNDLVKIFEKELISCWYKDIEKEHEILRLKQENEQYRFVMRISDDISAEMQREIDALKARLNHKKRPVNGNS